jgi:hypothetical protein
MEPHQQFMPPCCPNDLEFSSVRRGKKQKISYEEIISKKENLPL